LIKIQNASVGAAQHWRPGQSQCPGTAHLNICNDREVNRLAVALDSLPTEVYEAVAAVADRICCIRAHVRKTTRPMQAPHERIHVLDLPPLGDALTEEATFV
jgi:hypothetical protein